MRILLTGGAGFIGSNLADAFIAENHEVLVLDDLSTGRRSNVPARAALVEGDIRDPATRGVVAKFEPDVLCHHAAQIDVRKSVADPSSDADVNIVGSVRLLEACRAAGTRRVLFASTGGAIYGEQDAHPATESHPARPVSPYGVAKLSVEHYLHYYAVEHGFRATCLRYANVYGPRQNAHGEAGVIAIFVEKFLAGGAPTIHGKGEQTRDFVFVGDVVRANLAALEHDLTGAYNVGTGVETSVNALCEAIRAAVGTSLVAAHGPGKPGEQLRSSLDASALTRATGWKPETALADGIRATVEDFRAAKRTL
ncbi:MAG TPA: NAD-dependent epimerase/dehydratase family protein [Polyangiaceae bacterium]|jgi:UDP-glucose 4-epimerase|nr:NAD-dependent epimerase/dehydratase family protein [Polyangiaceae bacterium]